MVCNSSIKSSDFAFALFNFGQHGLEPLLKFAAELRARNQRAHIQGENGAILQRIGHVAPDDAQGQAFRNGGFAHARLADEDGVILCFAAKDADHVANLAVAPDHRDPACRFRARSTRSVPYFASAS